MSSRTKKRLRMVSAALVGFMLLSIAPVPPLAMGAPEQPALMAGREVNVLLFPVQVAIEGAPEDIGRWATNALQTAIDELPNMVCFDFSPTSPLVRRAAREGRVRTVDVEQGVSDPRTAIEVGHAMGANIVVMATLQSYRLAMEPTQAEVVLGGQAYDVKSNFDEPTLEAKEEVQVFRAFGVVGKSTARARYSGKEGVLVREALRDAAYRAAQVLAGVPAEEVVTKAETGKKHKAWRWFLILAGVAALAMAVNSGTEAKVAPVAGDEFRPRSLTAVAQPAGQSAIRVTWSPPRTTANMMGYELQRSARAKDSTASSPFVPIAGLTQLPANRTEWIDHGLDGANVYMYRLRARYSNRQPIPEDWVYTSWVGFSQ
jgi:hypothetical protein